MQDKDRTHNEPNMGVTVVNLMHMSGTDEPDTWNRFSLFATFRRIENN